MLFLFVLYSRVFTKHTENIIFLFFEKDHSLIFYLKRYIMFSGKQKTLLIIQEIPYYSIIYFGDTIFSEHLEKKTVVFGAV